MYKSFIWKIRYTLYMQYLTGVGLSFCWNSANTSAEDQLEENPKDAVDNDVSRWYG